jgi:hypothetical protein
LLLISGIQNKQPKITVHPLYLAAQTTGRKPFQSMRYIYLIDRKETLPVNLAKRLKAGREELPPASRPFFSAIANTFLMQFFSIVFDFIFLCF